MKLGLLIMCCFLCFGVKNSWSGGLGIAPASEPTQLLNLGGLAEIVDSACDQVDRLNKIVEQNVDMVSDYINQAKVIPDVLFRDVTDAISDVTSTIDRTKGVWESAKGIEDNFKQKFKGYEYWLENQFKKSSFSKQVQDWETKSKNATEALMNKSVLSFINKDKKEEQIGKLRKLSKNSKGRNQILQTSNLLADSQIESLKELNTLIAINQYT